MSGNSSPRAGPLAGLSPSELDSYAQYAWLSGRVGEAIDLYSDLARLYRRSPHVHFKLGYLYLSLHDHTAAIKHFTLEIERHGDEVLDAPPSPDKKASTLAQQQRAFLLCTYAGRSDALAALGETSKAELDQLFSGGNAVQSLLAMGCLYFRFGMNQRADQCFERCGAADGEDPRYLVEHAELRLAQRRYAHAAAMFEKCRSRISSSSPIYHRALIGEGSALIRQNKLQDAVILLLQAMNTLRNTIRAAQSEEVAAEQLEALVLLYHRAVNLYGGLCLMKGELKAALDTYCSIFQPASSFTTIVSFHLPTMCITPGTKSQYGDVIDSTKVSTKNLSEAIRHLNEMEWRYGPDPCLYFHRANLHRATGEFDSFIHDLSLVESLDPSFLSKYLRRDSISDFFDGDTLSWIPIKLIESIHDALERNEYRTGTSSAPTPATPQKAKFKTIHAQASVQKHRNFSEIAMLVYLENRAKVNPVEDEFANVFQLDIRRRLPESQRKIGQLSSLELAQWEGVVFDEVYADVDSPVEEDQPLQDAIRATLDKSERHPCAQMFAGMIELAKFNVVVAHQYFTQAINLVDSFISTVADASVASQSSLSQRWQLHLLQQVKYYSLIWRSMTSRLKIEMEKAVEDLNLAAAVRLGDQLRGSDDPLLIIQRTLIMLLNGHLKSAYKLLRQLKKNLRLAIRNRLTSHAGAGFDVVEVIDMFSCVGLNSFHLLHFQIQEESAVVAKGHGGKQRRHNPAKAENELNAYERAQEEKEEREEEESAISMVKYALTKKTIPQAEMLDKFYEAGLLKLSATGSISQVIPFFQAVLSMDENYLPPTNFASLEILKCKEQEFMEEKLFNCFIRLGKRSKWLEKKIKWKFEALIDSNLAHAYLPSDMETLWHRARLLQGQNNFVAAINDLTDCLQLMSTHFTWERGKKGEKASFSNETKRTQWLQLQLERGLLHMELHHWERAIDDLTMVIAQAGKKNPALLAGAHEARSSCLVRLKRYGHAIQDLQTLLSFSKESRKSKKAVSEELQRRQDRMLNCILVGNLYCQLAVDQMKSSSALTRKATVMMNPQFLRHAKAANMNMGFITRAREYYDEAEAIIPDHFLIHYFRGRVFAISGHSQLATRSLTQCLRVHSMFLPALFLRGCIYAQENLFVLALADFYRVRHRISSYPNLHTSIGYCHLERGSLTKAVESFTEALLQRPHDCDALYMRGCALQELLILDNSIKDFEQVVALKPDSFRAHYQHAICNILLKNYRAAIAATNIVVRLQPDWRDAWILHGYASFCADSFDIAVSSYGSAIALPDVSEGVEQNRQRDSALFLYRAIAYIQSEKFSAALTDLELALKRDNENYVAFIAKAYCLTKMGDSNRAAQALAHCLPHYKEIKLPPATEVHDSERMKLILKTEAIRDGANLSSSVTQSTSLSGTASTSLKSSVMVAASCEKLFLYRKQLRDSEPKQSLRPITSLLSERRSSSTNIGGERRMTEVVTSERHTSADIALPTSARKSRLFSTNSSLTAMDVAAELAKARAKQTLKTKFLRAMKKITFQYRVLKALESVTSSKYKKSQQMTRALTETLSAPNRVGWPRGTLTTRVLVWAFNAFGIHHAKERKVDDALMAFTLAIQSHPLNSDSHFNRGNMYLQIEVLHSAASGYQDAIEQDDNCFRAHNNIGVAYYKLERFEEAQDAFSTGLHHAHLAKERAILMYNLGVTFQALEKPDEALDFYQQAISLDSSRTEFFNNRSAILHHQMRYAVALEDYNRALKLQIKEPNNENSNQLTTNPSNDVASRLNRAQLYIAMGNCTLATRDLTTVLDILTTAKDKFQRELHDETGALAFAASAATAKVQSLDSDIELATELLAFTRKWHTAMRIAVKDFLFALHALPCFTMYEFSPLFSPELVRLQEREAETAYAGSMSPDADRLEIVPLPIEDFSFFNYEREFGHWIVAHDFSDENEDADTEQQQHVRAYKHEQWSKGYASDLRDAMRYAKEESFQEAARSLLRAHYKTSLESHEEYLLLTWRIQMTIRIETADEGSDFGLTRAIMVLREFLEERRTPDEVAENNDVEEIATARQIRGSRMHNLEDGDDDVELMWRAQRRMIRADLYCLLGSLYQFNGELVHARVSYKQALRLRDDHAIAMLNILQLSVVLGEYEEALDSCLHLLDVFLTLGKAKRGQSNPVVKPQRGLLNADRSVLLMIPSIEETFADAEVASLGVQLHSLLKDYRGLISAQIQANTSHIFKTQGAIAHIVQQLRYHHSNRQLEAAKAQHNLPDATELDVEAFNETLDEYEERILQAPSEFANDPSFDDFYASFQTQFADLCDRVVKSLPPEAVEQAADQFGDSSDKAQGGNNQVSEETIEEFLANLDHRDGHFGRRLSGRPRPRPMSTPGGSFTNTSTENTHSIESSLTPRRKSTLTGSAPLQPARPKSGPQYMRKQRTHE